MFFTEKFWLTYFLTSQLPSKPILLLEFLKIWMASSGDVVGYKSEPNWCEILSPGHGREASSMIAQQHCCLIRPEQVKVNTNRQAN